MNSKRLFMAMLASLLLLASCSKKEADILKLSTPLPGGLVPPTSVITFNFSKAVMKIDSVNQWTSTPFIEFTPAIPGKFVWQDSSILIFSPDGPLPGDTKFTGRLNTSLLLQMSGMKSFEGKDEFTFGTESFAMRQAEFFYDRLGEKRQVGIKANLEFTYAVNPQDVANTIRLTIDKEPQKLSKVNTTEKNRIIAVEIGVFTQLERAREIAIDFSSDLISPETNTHIKMERPFVYTMPGLEELKIYGHEVGFDGTTSWIKIRTSQEIDKGSVQPFLTIDPVREYTISSDAEGFTLKGKFEPGTAFRLTIKQGLESLLGGRTQNQYDADIIVGNVAPSFGFASKSGVYMLLSGQRGIEIKTINLPKVNVRVSQIFQNNLVFFLDQGRSYDYDYDYYDDEEGFSGSYRRKFRYNTGNYGRVLSNDSISVKNIVNQEVTTLFDLKPFMNTGYKGFYLVEIANPVQAWRSTSKLISVSNIGLIVKKSATEIVVFATSLETNEPISGALINVISTDNQVIASQKTDGDGAATFSNFEELRKGFMPKLITAELESDFNFINLADYRVETSRYDVDGKYDVANVYDAFMYGDRNIYRPGEKIYLSGIVRNLTHDLTAQLPVKMKVFSPQGTMLRESQHTLNEQGSFETNYQTSLTSQTGSFRFELYTGNNLYLSSYGVSVEDFVPDRLKVKLTASAEKAKPGDKVKYDLEALNFFGPPAAGRNYEFEGSFAIIPYTSKAFPSFRFSDDGATNYEGKPEVYTGKTNDDGKATIEFPLPRILTSTGLLRAKGRIGVFDESGRPVYQIAQTIVHPKDYFIGVLNQGSYYMSPNAPQKMQIVAVDMDDKAINGFKAKVELYRFEWHSVLRQHPKTNTLRYVSERREILVKTDKITLSDKPTEFSYSSPRSGEYAVRVSKDGEAGYNQFYFYSYSWGSSDITSFEIDPEARIDMVFDKKIYAPGDKAKILFQAPFNAKMLVTVERNQVFSYRYLDVVNNAASMELGVVEKFLPNVYVSAVLFRKIKEMNIPLMAGHGFAPLMVEKKSNRLDVAITAPPKIRPKTKQTVMVKTNEKNVFLTLAAVDEGICQVKNYKTPDPYTYFYAKKALQTETFDFFRDLIPEPAKSAQKSSTGGDEAAAMAKRVNPLGVQRFKPLAIWSGILQTNGDGTANVVLDVPEFNGELRLMVLAYKGDRFGSAEQGMKVADPVVLTPALPRFLSPNDTLSMALTAFNTTENPVSLTFDVEASGGVVPLTKSASLDVGANQERFVNIMLKSTNEIGKAMVKVRTTAFGEKLESTTELPVRPIAPFVAEGISGFVDGGSSTSHDIGDVYLPYGRHSHINLSPYPVANFSKELKYLMGYPHGCLEQTVSKAFPQIYLRDIAVILDPTILNTGSPTYFVNEAITKITSMQLHDGSFSYWPGWHEVNNWTTVYATHFLLEAKKAGYSVPEVTLKSAVNAVGQIARSKLTTDYYYYQGQKTVIRRIADKSALYALYTIALAGSPDKAIMNFYRNEKSLLTTDTQFLLAGAFALSGDRRTFTELLPPEFKTEEAVRTSGYCFDSPIRANALILNILLDTDLNNSSIPRYMEYLSKTYRRYYWYSTQDNAFTLLAFGKAARMASSTKVDGTIKVGTKDYSYKGGNQKFDLEPYGKKVSLSMEGSGRVYYSIVTEGIRSDGKVQIEDKGLQVRREFFNRNGEPVSMGSIKQNDLIIIKLALISSVDLLENVAISDLLPAGFEIENPRITETTDYAFIKNATSPQYMDIRDDRINIYTSFRGGNRTQIFYYMVRAVTPGVFHYAPVVAEAMYNAEYYSANGQTKVRVAR
jgi:uncharacterized protein YfaS (alpha-2-macroglobulin family)